MAETLHDVFRAQVRRHGDEMALVEQDNGSLTWQRWAFQVDACAASIAAAGHRAGERGAIFAGNTLLWPVADLALMGLGMVSVGIFPTSSPSQLRELLDDAGVSIVFVDSAARLADLLSVRPQLPGLRTVVAACEAPDGVHQWQDWLQDGSARFAPRFPRVDPADDAIIIYTSGSTGTPRGARISHRYLLASAQSIQQTLGFQPGERVLSFLPFSHAAERVFGHARRILSGDSALLIPDHRRVWQAAASFHPTVFGGLPRFYEKLYEMLQARRSALAGAEAERWDAAVALGRRRSQMRRAGLPVPQDLEADWQAASARSGPRAALDEHLGGAVRVATSGGAALPAEVVEYLDACGLTVFGAYGLTEHLCVASHRPESYSFEGVGPAMDGTTIRIADDGEVLVRRCDLTFSGYLNRDAETQAMFTSDGAWLRTGDLGRLDDDGCLHITGRIKELIALSTGRKVAPAPIEARLTAHPWIGQAVLVGEGRKYMTAVLSLRRAAVEGWAAEHGILVPWTDLLRHDAVRARLADAMEAVNQTLAASDRVRRWIAIDREFDAENREVTPTMKVRRAVVAEHFAVELDALYREEPA